MNASHTSWKRVNFPCMNDVTLSFQRCEISTFHTAGHLMEHFRFNQATYKKQSYVGFQFFKRKSPTLFCKSLVSVILCWNCSESDNRVVIMCKDAFVDILLYWGYLYIHSILQLTLKNRHTNVRAILLGPTINSAYNICSILNIWLHTMTESW